MTHLFIINPAAGSRDQTSRYREAIDRVCQSHGLTYRIAVSASPGDCRRIAAEAAATGEEYRIYACGGDGTLNEIVCGAAGYPNVAVTHYIGGSGNDFVKIFDELDAFRDLERLINCKETAFDLIRCNDDYSLNICSVGLDARIGTDVASYKRLPLLNGFRAYALSAVVNTIRGIAQHYVVEIDGETIDGDLTFVCACNGRYYGGGFYPVPEADPSDGLLDVLIVKKVTRMQVLRVVGKYKNGRYRELPSLVRHFRTRSLTITCDCDNSVNLDGELRTARKIEISIAKEKLRFFYPKELSYAPEIAYSQLS